MFKNQNKLNALINQIQQQQIQIKALTNDVQVLKSIVNADTDLNHFKDFDQRQTILKQQNEHNLLYRLMKHIVGYTHDSDPQISYLMLQNLFAISMGALSKNDQFKHSKTLRQAYATNPVLKNRYGVHNHNLIYANYNYYSGSIIVPDANDHALGKFAIFNPDLDNIYSTYFATDHTFQFYEMINQRLINLGYQNNDQIQYKDLSKLF